MTRKIIIGLLIAIAGVMLVGALAYFTFPNKSSHTRTLGQHDALQTIPASGFIPPAVSGTVGYINTKYDFSVELPGTWNGSREIEETWDGFVVDNARGDVIVEKGPLFTTQHPQWTEKVPRQGIPIMVFTLKQWDNLQQDKFHIDAAPVGPAELGRNASYVFALPARYNFAYLPGYEEVEQLLKNDAFYPSATRIPKTWPADVPVYTTNGTGNSASSIPQGYEPGATMVFQTTDTVETVAKYYTAELTAQGWAKKNELQGSKVLILVATKNNRLMTVTMVTMDDRTVVTMVVARK